MFNLVIAGPGAGKTTSLVKHIKETLADLSQTPYQFCAVITYTNAAAEEIRQRLQREMMIPSNVFIGTTHQFLIRFIIEPYAHLDNIPREKLYTDAVKLAKAMTNQYAQRATEKKIADSLAERGIIIYDKILEIADRLVDKPSVIKLLSERLKYIFIDEYQDTRLLQHQVFEKIYDQGNTNLRFIGDPLQSIYGFSYIQSQLKQEPKPASFSDAPILKLKNHQKCNLTYIKSNYRSSEEIVSLVNCFTQKIDLTQTAENNAVKSGIPIIFIENKTLPDIINAFDAIAEKHNLSEETDKLHKLLLAKEWKYFERINDSHQVDELDYGTHTINSQYQQVKQCVLAALGLKRKDIIEISSKETNFEKTLSWRLFCLQMLSNIKTTPIENVKGHIRQEFISKYKKPLPHADNSDENNTSIKSTVEKLCRSAKPKTSNSFYSSVHSAKGLEATCVLVYTNTNNQLEKWLDYDNVDNNDDNFRLGYVAFSRARKLLCVSCKEKPKVATLGKMRAMGFSFEKL